MVEIIRYRETALQVRGHAGSGEKGRDLVCAAVSALVLTLAANTDRMTRAGWVTGPVIRLGEGSAQVSCRPRPEYRAAVELVFEGLFAGFAVLDGKYPGYVKVLREEQEPFPAGISAGKEGDRL